MCGGLKNAGACGIIRSVINVTRKEFEDTVLQRYGVRADYPFRDDLMTGVFRHTGTGKWFALAMRISEKKLGRDGGEPIDVVNLKCAPEVIESLAGIEPGIYRAYHMNKTHWLTVSLGECDTDTVLWLLSISFDATRARTKRK